MSPLTAFGFTTIRGLPAHILIVHFAIVLVPLAAIALVASLRPAIALRFGGWLPVLSVAALLSVFAAMNAGGWLQNHVRNTALVRAHTSIAWELWPFSAAVAVLSFAVWRQWGRQPAGPAVTHTGTGRPVVAARTAGSARTTVIIGVLAVAMAVGSLVEVVRIGEAGSRAAWQGHFSQTQTGGY